MLEKQPRTLSVGLGMRDGRLSPAAAGVGFDIVASGVCVEVSLKGWVARLRFESEAMLGSDGAMLRCVSPSSRRTRVLVQAVCYLAIGRYEEAQRDGC